MVIMNQVKNIQKLASLSFFDIKTLSQLIDIKEKSLYENIYRWLTQGIIIQLKKGLYVTREHYQQLQEKGFYHEFIANKLKQPSYLSLEYVLQKHNILTEAVFALTSITLKNKRDYKNKLGLFIYRNIKDELFTGFSIVKKGEYEIKEASLAKALFDYLYLKLFRIQKIDAPLIESLRLNLESMTKDDLDEFSSYCEITKIKKYVELSKIIGELHEHCYKARLFSETISLFVKCQNCGKEFSSKIMMTLAVFKALKIGKNKHPCPFCKFVNEVGKEEYLVR